MLCKPRPSTDRLFVKQRAQQYTTSGRPHRDGKNAPWRICITGGGAVNPFQLKADGTPDAERFDCPSGSYHIMNTVATGLNSHAHHQAIIDESLLPVHGALTTFVLDLDSSHGVPRTWLPPA
ncbi:unnamed protein product [Pylaiella littoralis]